VGAIAAAIAPAELAIDARRASEPSAASTRPISAGELAAAEQRGYAHGVVDCKALGLKRGAKAGWRACAALFERDITVVSRQFAGEPCGHDEGEVEIARVFGLTVWLGAGARAQPVAPTVASLPLA
jgi:hypothetical protein